MHKIRVGVIRGGPSSEYDVSLKTGATVLKELSSDKYHVRDILIDRAGTWHVAGLPTTPHEALTHIDIAFNALHGHYGEDGKIQHIFETHKIPFTGSGSFASAIGMNKSLTKEIYRKEKIKSPAYKLLESLQDISKEAHKIFHAFPLPIVVKPVSGGSSLGITVVKNFKDFDGAVKKAFEYSNEVLVEEYIKGVESTVGVIDGFRDHILYALPAVEIRPRGTFFDYESKYSENESGAEEIVPGNFPFETKKELEGLAIEAHRVLGLKHYSRSDFIVSPTRGIFILETNTLPGLTPTSLFPKSLEAVGAPLHHFFDHIIELAMCKK